MDTLSDNVAHFGEYLLAIVLVPILLIGVKRMRERAQELVATYRVRKVLGRKGNVHRRREGVVQELKNIDDNTFKRMFRMPKRTFFELESRVGPLLRAKKRWSIHSDRMASLSSGSAVDTILHLAATIRYMYACHKQQAAAPHTWHRWLAGGSLWDIAFMLRISVPTVNSTKYLVCDCINKVLCLT